MNRVQLPTEPPSALGLLESNYEGQEYREVLDHFKKELKNLFANKATSSSEDTNTEFAEDLQRFINLVAKDMEEATKTSLKITLSKSKDTTEHPLAQAIQPLLEKSNPYRNQLFVFFVIRQITEDFLQQRAQGKNLNTSDINPIKQNIINGIVNILKSKRGLSIDQENELTRIFTSHTPSLKIKEMLKSIFNSLSTEEEALDKEKEKLILKTDDDQKKHEEGTLSTPEKQSTLVSHNDISSLNTPDAADNPTIIAALISINKTPPTASHTTSTTSFCEEKEEEQIIHVKDNPLTIPAIPSQSSSESTGEISKDKENKIEDQNKGSEKDKIEKALTRKGKQPTARSIPSARENPSSNPFEKQKAQDGDNDTTSTNTSFIQKQTQAPEEQKGDPSTSNIFETNKNSQDNSTIPQEPNDTLRSSSPSQALFSLKSEEAQLKDGDSEKGKHKDVLTEKEQPTTDTVSSTSKNPDTNPVEEQKASHIASNTTSIYPAPEEVEDVIKRMQALKSAVLDELKQKPNVSQTKEQPQDRVNDNAAPEASLRSSIFLRHESDESGEADTKDSQTPSSYVNEDEENEVALDSSRGYKRSLHSSPTSSIYESDIEDETKQSSNPSSGSSSGSRISSGYSSKTEDSTAEKDNEKEELVDKKLENPKSTTESKILEDTKKRKEVVKKKGSSPESSISMPKVLLGLGIGATVAGIILYNAHKKPNEKQPITSH